MTQDKALVEEVARAILANDSSAKIAEAVIAIVLERAAKVAEVEAYELMWAKQYYNGVTRANRDQLKGEMNPAIEEDAVVMGKRLGAAIRALMKQENPDAN